MQNVINPFRPDRHVTPAGRLCRLVLAALFFTTSGLAADKVRTRDVRDLFFGESLFYAGQRHYVDAVSRLDAELAQHYALDNPASDSLSYHREESELFVADLELSYRMHRKVGRAMKRLLDQSVHESIRDRAAYRLARVSFTKSDYETTLADLDHISKNAPRALQLQAALLRGQSLIALGRHKDAIAVLQPIHAEPSLAGFAPFNLGIAMIEAGDTLNGFRILDQVGNQADKQGIQGALRDKANLTLGFTLLNARQHAQARTYLERVRLEGPFSSKALLWVGWSDAAAGNYEGALVPWMMLRKRDITDVAVQEAMLAAPYGFGQLKAYGRSAVLYGEAVKLFDHEIDRVDDSIRHIREGKFLAAMLSDEARTNKQWLFTMRSLPDAPETRYMRDLMAGHIFNESYRNYRDLDELAGNVDNWSREIPGYRDLLRVRRAYYAPLLPVINANYRRLTQRLEQIGARRNELAHQLKTLLRKRDPMALATAEEKRMLRQLQAIKRRIDRASHERGVALLREQYARLSGLLHWRVNTEYEDRLSQAHRHLRQLDKVIAQTEETRTRLVREKSEAALSYQGYDRALNDLQARLEYLNVKISGLKAHQGQYMERRAVSELQRRKRRLQRYRTKARFALAESYDRALRGEKEKAKAK